MKIYIELSLCVNIVLNFFILKCTGKCLQTKPKFVFLSSVIGAVISLLEPMFNLNLFAKLCIQLLLSLCMMFLSFEIKPIKKFILAYCLFFAFTFLFGGVCYAVTSTFGQLPLLGVIGISLVVYCISLGVIKYQQKIKRIQQFSFKVLLSCNNNQIEEEGFLDSGNVLYDPVTKKPIILITFDVFKKLYSNIDFMSAYCKKVDIKKLEGAHYVKINTVASGTSILVFNAQKVEIIEGKKHKDFQNVSLGLSFSGFEKALGKKVLLHREFA